MKSIYVTLTLVIFTMCNQLKADEDASNPAGLSASLRNSVINDAMHGEIMVEGHASQTVTARAGLSFLLSENTGIHGGIEGGVRVGFPWRVAPFVGAGLFMGQWTEEELADSDGFDNNDDGTVDEFGEEKEVVDYLLAVYPEAGVHLWLSDSVRLTGSWRHYMTSKGPGSNRSLFGIGVAVAF